MNPELRRNLWLEFGMHRRIAVPAVLGLVLWLFAAGGSGDWHSRVHTAALTIYFFLVHLWGTRLASEAVSEEVRERTWDLQRLSALGPWAMTWGKLFGATVFSWYGGAICLLAIAISARGDSRFESTGWLVLALVASALALHGAALAASLQAARKETRIGHRFGMLMLLVPVFLALVGIPMLGRGELHASVEWYVWGMDRIVFLAGSALAFALWAVFGAYREMCRELQVRTLPWAWPCFALFTAAWITGLAGGDILGEWQAFVICGLACAIALTYYALFAEVTTAMVIRRSLARLSTGNWRRALQECPAWPATLVLAALFAVAAPFVLADVGTVAGIRIRELQQIAVHAPIALVLVTARDCAILVFFASAPRPRRVEAATLLYIVLLWWIVPALLSAIGMPFLSHLVMPFGFLGGPQAAFVMGVQAALAWGLAAWRWNRVHARLPPR
jgi:hypothetical protein